jgi:AcrR family transcriptional regulator
VIATMVIVENRERVTAAPKRRGRPPAFVREMVLALATETFWRYGYEGASINDLTAAMGITAQSLYAAFGSKAALYEESLQWYLRNVSAYSFRALSDEANALDAVARLLREAAVEFSRPGRPNGCMVSTDVIRHAVENEQVAAIVARLRDESIERLENRIILGVKDRQIKRGTDPEALARFASAMIQGMSIQARDGAGKKELLKLAAIAITSLDSYRIH